MSRTIPASLLAALQSGTTTLCLCWQAIRADGTIFGFTDHDRDVTFDAGDGHGTIIYKASTSFTASDMQDQLGMAVSNVDLVGALSSEAITDADLEDGRWDQCAITVMVVDWSSPTLGHTVWVSGTTGQVTSGDLAFQAELRSLGQHLAQYIGSLVQPTCRSNLFDTGSGLDGGCNLAQPAAVAGTIATVTSRTAFKVTAAGSFPDGTKGSLTGGYFAWGTVTFTSGANVGLSREVFTSDSGLNFVMLLPFPEDIVIGDGVHLQFGCDKSSEVCIKNFANGNNFRGEPYVPGSDFVFQVHGE